MWDVTHHTMVHENVKDLMMGFRYDAHPMGMLVSTVGALSTFYPEAKEVHDPLVREKQIQRLIAKIPTLAAFAYRHSKGMPYVYPDNDLSFCGNFLNMMFKATELRYHVNPVLERAFDVLFILHADHEQNCSTSAMRGVGSSYVDPTRPRRPRSARSTGRSTAAPTSRCCGCSRRSARRTRCRRSSRRSRSRAAR